MVHNLLSINTYNTVGLRRISFFSEIRSPRSVTPFYAQTHTLPLPKKIHRGAAPFGLYLDRNRLFHQITPFLIKTHIKKEEIVWRRKKWIEEAQTAGGQEGCPSFLPLPSVESVWYDRVK